MKDNTVKCPNCKEVFKVDDSVYTDIVKQVGTNNFRTSYPVDLQLLKTIRKSSSLAQQRLKNTINSSWLKNKGN